MSVRILSTVETSCTTNPQQIEVMELEGYSRPTCSKQPRLVDCRIGVVNKLDRRRRQLRVLLTARSTRRGEIFEVRSLEQSSSGKYPNFGDSQIYLKYSLGQIKGSLHTKNQLDSSSRFDTISACGRRADGRTDKHTNTANTSLT